MSSNLLCITLSKTNNMLSGIKALLSCFIIVALIGCEKEGASSSDSENEIVSVGGNNYKVLSETNVDLGDGSINWIGGSGGSMSVDSTSRIGDSTVLYMTAKEGCFTVNQKEGTSTLPQQQSAILFSYMLPTTTFSDVQAGRGYTCAGACRMEILQGNEIVLSEWVRERDFWTSAHFQFRTKSVEPIKIRFIVGTQNGFWIDDIFILEKL